MASPQHGTLLFAHGARDPGWAAPFEATAARLGELTAGAPVALAFLEFMAPDLATAGRQLAERGCKTVTVVPLFLGAGGHVRKDVPELLEQLRRSHPGVRWQLAPAVGAQPGVIEAMAQAALSLGASAQNP
jgi:sirohydrochlorin cobaltochelatase